MITSLWQLSSIWDSLQKVPTVKKFAVPLDTSHIGAQNRDSPPEHYAPHGQIMQLSGERDRVRQLRLMHPHWSLADIAQETGITRQRVHQLLRAEGLPTRRVTPATIIDRVLESMPERATLPTEGDSLQTDLQTEVEQIATETDQPPAPERNSETDESGEAS